ncbi:hypothetical protein [Ekhidna sp.]
MRRLFIFYFIILIVGTLSEEKETTDNAQEEVATNEIQRDSIIYNVVKADSLDFNEKFLSREYLCENTPSMSSKLIFN